MDDVELQLDEDGAIVIPEKILKKLKLKKGDVLSLSIKDDALELKKKKEFSQTDYDELIEKAEEYAKQNGLPLELCYNIVEEFLKTN